MTNRPTKRQTNKKQQRRCSMFKIELVTFYRFQHPLKKITIVDDAYLLSHNDDFMSCLRHITRTSSPLTLRKDHKGANLQPQIDSFIEHPVLVSIYRCRAHEQVSQYLLKTRNLSYIYNILEQQYDS